MFESKEAQEWFTKMVDDKSKLKKPKKPKKVTNLIDCLKKLKALLIGTIGCTIFCGLTVILPVSMIIIGAIHLHDCPVEPNIPKYLIVGGVRL